VSRKRCFGGGAFPRSPVAFGVTGVSGDFLPKHDVFEGVPLFRSFECDSLSEG
jgi:hypothetical protein